MARRRRRNPAHAEARAAAAPAATPGTETGGWPFTAAAIAIVTLGCLLRIYQLGSQELWLDEAVSFRITVLESGLGDALLNQNTPPVYYLLLRPWVWLAGHSEAAVRAPSVLFGTLFVAVAIWLGTMAFNRKIGLWSGLFAAVNPIHIYYSQEARAYAVLMFLVVLSYALLWRALQTDSRRMWTGFAASAALALYSHYMAILSLAPTGFLVLLWQGERPKGRLWRHYALAAMGVAVLFAPWAALRFAFHDVTGVDWIGAAWEYSGIIFAIPRSLEVLGLGSEQGLIFINLKQYVGIVFPWGLRLLGLGLLVLLVGAFLVPWGDRALGVPWIGERKGWLALFLFFPLVILWGVSIVHPFYVVGRYDMTAFPAYPFVLGIGIAKIGNIRKTGPFFAALLALLYLSVVGAKLFAYYHTENPLAEARSTAEFLDRNVSNGDVVVFTGLSAAPIVYYLYRRGYAWEKGLCQNPTRDRNFGCLTFPRETEGHVGVYQHERVLHSIEEVRRDIRTFIAELEGPGSRLWLVLETVESSPEYDYILPPADARMVAELRSTGFQPEFAEGRILRFAR